MCHSGRSRKSVKVPALAPTWLLPRRGGATERLVSGARCSEVVVPQDLNLVRELDIGAGVDATQLAAFMRIEPASARVGILRLNL